MIGAGTLHGLVGHALSSFCEDGLENSGTDRVSLSGRAGQPHPAAASASGSREDEEQQHEQENAEPAARVVAPAGAVRPNRKHADHQQQNQKQQKKSHDNSSPSASMPREGTS